jgi:hypothetical protein
MHLLKIRTWGIEWKGVIDKIVKWAAWRWANVKIDKRESFYNKTKCKHFQG